MCYVLGAALMAYCLDGANRCSASNRLVLEQIEQGAGGLYEKLPDGTFEFVNNHKLRAVPPELWHRRGRH